MFFRLLTFCLLRSLSAFSNSFYLSFFSLLPLFLGHLMQSPIAILIFLTSISPPFSGHLLSAIFSSSIFLHDQPLYSSPIYLRTFLHSNLHSHFIHFLLSALLTPTIILTKLVFRKPGPSVVFLLVSSSLVYSCMPA